MKKLGTTKIGFIVNHRYSEKIVTNENLRGSDRLGYSLLYFVTHNVKIVKVYRHRQGFCLQEIHNFIPNQPLLEESQLVVKKLDDYIPPTIDESLKAFNESFLVGNTLFITSNPSPLRDSQTWAVIATL